MAGMKKIMENMQTQLSKLAKTGVTNIKNTNTIGGEDNRTNTDKKYWKMHGCYHNSIE